MSDLITDEMVETAARELFEWDVEEHPDPRPAWEGLTEGQRDVWRSGARATLTSAALLIAAAAWGEGHDAAQIDWKHLYDGHPVGPGEMCDQCGRPNPYTYVAKYTPPTPEEKS